MRIVITEVREDDAFYPDRHLVIGLLGEVVKITSTLGDSDWSTIHMKPNELSCNLLGFAWPYCNGVVCFLAAKYRKDEEG